MIARPGRRAQSAESSAVSVANALSAPRSRLFNTLPAGLRGSGSSRSSTYSGTLKSARWTPTVRAHVLDGGGRAVPELHHRLHLLAELAVGHADDGGVDDVGMLEQDLLDLDAVHVLAAADDHVLGPVDEVEEAVGVEAADVAAAEPPLGRDRLRVRLRPVPVAAQHDRRPAQPDLAGLADGHVGAVLVDDPDLHRRHGPAHRVGMGGVVVADVRGRDRRRLGEAVGGGEGLLDLREALPDPLHELGRGRGAAVAGPDDRRQVVVVEVGRLDEAPHDRGDPADGRDLLLLDRAHGGVDVEAAGRASARAWRPRRS